MSQYAYAFFHKEYFLFYCHEKDLKIIFLQVDIEFSIFGRHCKELDFIRNYFYNYFDKDRFYIRTLPVSDRSYRYFTCYNCSIDFKLCIMIPEALMYNLEVCSCE